VLDHRGSWDVILPLEEFTYNNNHHASIGMPPYEVFMVGDIGYLFFGIKMGR